MVLQYLFNGMVSASILVLGAIGLTLIYAVKKFANLAHGDMLTLGAYVTFTFLAGTRSFVAAVLVACLFVAAVGILQEVLIYAHLEYRGPVAALVASVGVALVLHNAIVAYYGPGFLSYGIRYPDNIVLLGGALSLNPVRDLVPLAVGFSVAAVIILFLRFAKLGKAMRATADNRDLARVSGVNTRLVYWATWAIAGAASAVAGTLIGITSTILGPNMGLFLLLPLFAAVIVGGIGSPMGAVVGSIIVGLSTSLFFAFSVAFGVDPRWQIAVPFGLLVIMLLLRPSGLLGRAVGTEVRPLRKEILETLRSIRRGLGKWSN